MNTVSRFEIARQPDQLKNYRELMMTVYRGDNSAQRPNKITNLNLCNNSKSNVAVRNGCWSNAWL